MSATVPFSSQPNLSGLRPVNSNLQSERANQGSDSFAASSSLSGSAENDLLLLNLIIVLVQLLLQQFDNGLQYHQESQGQDNNQSDQGIQQNQQPLGQQNIRQGEQSHQEHLNNPQEQQSDDAQNLTRHFTDSDKALLLNAIGRDAEAGTTINRIEDRNASGNLNDGDNLELQTNIQLEDHAFTDDESRDFIEARNPPGTAKLPLTEQQTTLLESHYSVEEISIADNNDDQQISVGDFLTGFRMQDGRKVQLDIPVDQELLTLLRQ